MNNRVGLSKLRRVAILFAGDFHELASFILQAYAAQDRATGAESRPTVHGIASAYARLVIDLSLEAIEDTVKRHGIDLGAVVEFDDNLA